MGRSAKIGLFLLMGLVVALARLIEVEIGKPRPPAGESLALAVVSAPPTPKRSPHPVLPHIAKHAQPAPAPAAKAPVPAASPSPAGKPAAPVSDAQAEWPKGPIYTVRKGETPASIAKKVLGSSKLWTRIYELNKSRLANPNVVKPGTRLVVPPKEPGTQLATNAGKPAAAEKDDDD